VRGRCRTNLTEIGEGRRKVVSINLDRMADSVSGQTVVDPKGYLTDLNSIVLSSDAEIGDIKKARMLLKSVINTNPKHAPGWVAAARLEELAGCALLFTVPLPFSLPPFIVPAFMRLNRPVGQS
jgi:pre-mRNA-processing factor 6